MPQILRGIVVRHVIVARALERHEALVPRRRQRVEDALAKPERRNVVELAVERQQRQAAIFALGGGKLAR